MIPADGSVFENEFFRITLSEYMPEFYEVWLEFTEKKEKGEVLGEKESKRSESLSSLLEEIISACAGDETDSLILHTYSRKYEKVLKKNGFLYDITDFIFEYGENSDIIRENAGDCLQLICEEEGEAKKYSVGKEGEVFSCCTVTEEGATAFISGVETREKYRRKGYAARLMLSLADIYIRKNMKLRLHTDSENEAATGLYKKCGFCVCEELHSYVYEYE